MPASRARHLATLTAAVLTTATVLACGGFGADTPSKSQGDPTASTSADAAADPVAKIGVEGFTYKDGLQVQVLSAKKSKAGAYAVGVKPGQVVVRVTVKLTNKSKATVDLALVQVSLKAGADGLQAEQVFDHENGLANGFTGSVAPGRNASAVYGFAVAPADASKVNIEVTPGLNYSASIFEGAAA